MAKKLSGLGRGLGSLFGDMDVDLSVLDPAEISVDPGRDEETGPAETQAGSAAGSKPSRAGSGAPSAGKSKGSSAESVVFISLDDIKPNAAQPRKVFGREALEDLASSIREHGVIQPVLVRPSKTGYELVAGERRWRAARLAGLKLIPAIIRELDERQNMFYALIENMQREDLNSIEEALGLEEMMQSFGLNQEEAARAVGKSRSYVANALRLLKLPGEVREMVMDGRLSAGHARAIAGMGKEEEQLKVARTAAQKGWSVRQVESYSCEKKKGAKKRGARASKSAEFAAVERQLSEKLGTKVKISGSERRGRLELEYYSRGELDRLVEMLESGAQA